MAQTLEELLPMLARLSAERDERVPLVALAKEAGLSPSHFQRVFARLVGESPKQFTKRLQLECGAVLLLCTEYTVLDTALAAGFETHEGFTRAFTKRFGRSPREFRDQGVSGTVEQQLQHAQLIQHVGPCLHLFHKAATKPDSARKKNMNYDITQQPVEAMTLLYKTARVESAKIAEALGQILPAVFQHATKEGITMVGPPLCRYLAWGPAMVTLEAGMPVVPGSTGSGDIKVATVDAGPAAVTVHTGPYDGLGDAHGAVELYLHEHGLEAGGPPMEIYLTDPGEVPDPAEWKTQVLWPLEG